MDLLKNERVQRVIRLALEEDIGSGDITSAAVIPKDMNAKGFIVAKEDCVVCGMDVAKYVFLSLDSQIRFSKLVDDGTLVKSGKVLAEVTGNARAILSGERTALNFLQRMSGVATKTREFADMVKKCDVVLLDTRKTTPGLRDIEKYAVKAGGGRNHRFGLYDEILIKDNHIKLAGLENSVRRAKKTGKRIEVETCSLDEVGLALKSGADIIMLDNMPLEEIRKAVSIINKKAVIEVSGGVNENNIEEIAKLGVDWVSVGRLTHSVKSVEIGMEIEEA